MNDKCTRNLAISPRQLIESSCNRFGFVQAEKRLLFHSPSGDRFPGFEQIASAGWRVQAIDDSSRAGRLLGAGAFDVGVYLFPEDNAPDVEADIDALLSADPSVLWIALLQPSLRETDDAAHLITRYFFDYHTLPPRMERLLITLGHACGMARMYKRLLDGPVSPAPAGEIIGDSPVMQALMHSIAKVAHVDAPVLISGESGTGKELAARAIHLRSARAEGPFIAVNCGALPPTLIQAELFGHEKGSFTGAGHRRIGRFEAADGGTLFLDEIGDLPLDLQINLLRFLEEKTIERVGSTQSIPIDARIITASHLDLGTAVENGTFREDLYFRINVLPLAMPRLTEREGDIQLLAQHFFHLFGERHGIRTKGFSHQALAIMDHYAWPGNVRELINRVRRAVVMAEGQLITPDDLGLSSTVTENNTVTLAQVRADAEARAIRSALLCADRNATQAARDLGISRAKLYRLMERYRIRR